MQQGYSTRLQQVLNLLAGLLILKVTASVILGYRDYLPPNFDSDFLRGRDVYFSGWYQWAFYSHIATGPCSLIFGMLLISDRFRLRFPNWHRFLGRIQVACVLLVVTPSGLWMARYAAAGPIAGAGLTALGVLTAVCVTLGWRSAVQRKFAVHRRWMWRCFLLLCSAVVLRMIGGLGTVIGVQAIWYDPLATWLSWLLPLAAYELNGTLKRRTVHSPVQPVPRVSL